MCLTEKQNIQQKKKTTKTNPKTKDLGSSCSSKPHNKIFFIHLICNCFSKQIISCKCLACTSYVLSMVFVGFHALQFHANMPTAMSNTPLMETNFECLILMLHTFLGVK